MYLVIGLELNQRLTDYLKSAAFGDRLGGNQILPVLCVNKNCSRLHLSLCMMSFACSSSQEVPQIIYKLYLLGLISTIDRLLQKYCTNNKYWGIQNIGSKNELLCVMSFYKLIIQNMTK
jgi:hypothetical protein